MQALLSGAYAGAIYLYAYSGVKFSGEQRLHLPGDVLWRRLLPERFHPRAPLPGRRRGSGRQSGRQRDGLGHGGAQARPHPGSRPPTTRPVGQSASRPVGQSASPQLGGWGVAPASVPCAHFGTASQVGEVLERGAPWRDHLGFSLGTERISFGSLCMFQTHGVVVGGARPEQRPQWPSITKSL